MRQPWFSFYNMVDEMCDSITQTVLFVKTIVSLFCRKSQALQGPPD